MSPSPTIAFVCDAIYPYNKGGKETRLYEMSTRLAQRGYNVHIYCMQWWKGKPKKIENGVHLHGICPYIPLYSGSRRSIKQGVLFGLSCFKLITAQFDVIDVDHMPFFPLYAVRIVCWLKGKQMVASWHEVWGMKYWREYLGPVKGTIAGLIEKYSVKLPNKIIAISPLTAKKLQTILKVPAKKVSVVACGYNAETITESKKSSEKSDVIFVGRLIAHKNVDVLIEAIALVKKTHPKLTCRIIGTGPEEKKLHELAKKLDLNKNIIFHQELPDHHEVFSLMKASKVFVLPSTREGFGIVVVEANACGLPVIAIDHPDNAAKDISQKLVSLDPAQLAEAIAQLLKKPHAFDSAFSKHLQSYTWDKITNDLTKVYRWSYSE